VTDFLTDFLTAAYAIRWWLAAIAVAFAIAALIERNHHGRP